MEENKNTEEQELDLLELAKKLWQNRKLVYKWCGIALFVGLVIGFSIPKEYTSSVILSPEVTSNGMNGSVSQLAGMMGFNVGSTSRDAVYPTLYPDVVRSAPFIADLFSLEVTDRKGNTYTLYDYVDQRTRQPWWDHVKAFPFKVIGWVASWFKSDSEDDEESDEINTYRLTRSQMRIMYILSDRINVMVDKKTMVVTLSVTMQDPEISAAVAQTVTDNLQRYITTYRTGKARKDLEFAEKFFEESRENYEKAQERYARYADHNQNIVLKSVRVEQDRLENEARLTYNVYNQASQQLLVARAKVQESTPVYAVIKPVMVPHNTSNTSKLIIVLGCMLFAAVCSAAWILVGRTFYERFKTAKHNETEDK